MNEAETRAELIDPALREAGWGVVADSRVRRETICPGRIEGVGRRGKPEIADYVLTFRNHKLAVIEAKAADKPQFNRTIEIEERERYRVKLFMEQVDQREKTLVFCATQAHAALVRDLINQMKKSSDPNYCVRVTAEDGERGEQWLRTFQDNEKTVPTILTTSQKLSTGVDARNVRNIVLMRPIGTMIEFKQIIGRGTRLFDGKDYFTIYDFVKAYEHFNDPEWDGEPMEPVVAEPKPPKQPGCEEEGPDYEPEPRRERPKQIKIRLADGKERMIQHMMATSYWSPEGKPISANQMIEKLFGELPRFFKDEEELRRLWSRPDTRKALLQGLSEKGFGHDQLSEISRMVNAENSDVFDVLAYIAFALAPVTRSERVERRKNDILGRYDTKLQVFLDFVLAQYVKQGVGELDQEKLGDLLQLKYHTINDAAHQLGGVPVIRDTFIGFQRYLYEQHS
jgi:type I restriction enzyme R subunit